MKTLLLLLMLLPAVVQAAPCSTQEECHLYSMFRTEGVREVKRMTEIDAFVVKCVDKSHRIAEKGSDFAYICRTECRSRETCDLWNKFSYDGVDIIVENKLYGIKSIDVGKRAPIIIEVDGDRTEYSKPYEVRCWDMTVHEVTEEELATVCQFKL